MSPRDLRTLRVQAFAAGHLGEWTERSAITFGPYGQPFYIQGPDANPTEVMRTLWRGEFR